MKSNQRATIETLLERNTSQREIARITGIDRKTVRSYHQRWLQQPSNSPGVATGSTEQIPPPWPPAPVPVATSLCEPWREFIEAQLRLKRNATANRKGTVEHAIGHTQATALKGRRFESIEAQNEFLAHWEKSWAAKRIHGTERRQVQAMFEEERSHLKALPLLGVQYFEEAVRTVCDDSCVRVDHSSYAARPAPIGSKVLVRIYAQRIEIRDMHTRALLRTHAKAQRPGTVVLPMEERVFNPSRETRLILRQAGEIGEHASRLCELLFAIEGRVTERRFKRSGLDERPSLADFDWRFNPKLPRSACFELHTLKFIGEGANALIIGKPGTGKSHVAKAVAYQATLQGYDARYLEADTEFARYALASDSERTGLLKDWVTPDLIILDDLFLARRISEHAAEVLQAIVHQRYKLRRSIVITSNRVVQDWGKYLGDATMATTILDRLMHRCAMLEFEGKSYRLKEAAARIAINPESS